MIKIEAVGIEILDYKELTIGSDALTLDQLITSAVEEERERYLKKALEYLFNNIEDFGKKAKYIDGEKGWIYNCVSLSVAINAVNIMRYKAIRGE